MRGRGRVRRRAGPRDRGRGPRGTPGRVASDAFTVKTLVHSIADFRLAGATGELAASFGPGRFFEKVTLTRVVYSMVLPLWWNSIGVSYSGADVNRTAAQVAAFRSRYG